MLILPLFYGLFTLREKRDARASKGVETGNVTSQVATDCQRAGERGVTGRLW